ncbi:hypothetical protein [Metapseudomonas sp. CR1201]
MLPPLAHSHNVSTLLLDWLISLVCYRLVLYRPAPLEADAALPASTS